MKQSNEKMTRHFDEKQIKNGPWGSPWGPLEGPWRAPGTLPGPPGTEPDPFWRSGKKSKKKMSAQGAQKSQF